MTQIKLQKLVEKMLDKDIKVTDKEIEDYMEKSKNNIPKDMSSSGVSVSARQQLESKNWERNSSHGFKNSSKMPRYNAS